MKRALALVLILSAVGASAEQPVADAVWETVHRLDRRTRARKWRRGLALGWELISHAEPVEAFLVEERSGIYSKNGCGHTIQVSRRLRGRST